MEAAEILAKRLMAQFKDRLPLKQICDEILVVLGDAGVQDSDGDVLTALGHIPGKR